MKLFKNKDKMMAWCCKKINNSTNAAIEFGVCSGHSLKNIRKNYDGPVYGFDSFNGLPEFWREGFEQGHFKTSLIPEIEGATIIVGLFQETLDKFLEKLKTKISLVHFDADLYSSTIYCLNAITPHLLDGCIFIFDEYHNYPGWEQHEFKAFSEWLENNPWLSAVQIAETQNDEQVAFSITINR